MADLTKVGARLVQDVAGIIERLAIGAVTEAEARGELLRLLHDASVGVRAMVRRAEDEQQQVEERR